MDFEIYESTEGKKKRFFVMHMVLLGNMSL